MSEEIVSELRTVTLTQAVQLTLLNPDVIYMWRGEPGVGKSSAAQELARQTGYPLAMIDVPNLDLGDVAMPVIDHESKVTRYYPNARFALERGEPVVLCLDEFTKGAEPVKNMLHPMLEVFKPRLGDIELHPQTIRYMTGNLDTDGVGDGLAQHTRQRVVELIIRKPDANDWNAWALHNGIDPIVMAWVDRYPQCLASYLDGEKNEFIFNPAEPQDNVVSPRTLEIASRQIAKREHIDEETMLTALTGTLGASGAESIMSFIRFQDSLPSFNSIFDSPDTARIPTEQGARAVLTFGLLERVEKDTLTNILKYLKRMEEEWQVIFGVALAKHKTKSPVAFANRGFADWARENEDLL